MKKEEKGKRLKYRGKQQKSDTMHSAPSDKEESLREDESNETSDDDCVVTFSSSGSGKEKEKEKKKEVQR